MGITAVPRASGRRSDDTDAYVGARLRVRRELIKMSQEDLAGAVGVTFQQIQKYESGDNRLSASRLHRAAAALGVPVGWFFEGLGKAASGGIPVWSTRQLEILRHLQRLDAETADKLLALARGLGR